MVDRVLGLTHGMTDWMIDGRGHSLRYFRSRVYLYDSKGVSIALVFFLLFRGELECITENM
jgi:hypothetical protein